MTVHHSMLRFAAAAVAVFVSFAPANATTIERVVSPGGIEAWLVREPSIPLIAMNFAFKGGANQDPALKPGTGTMVASLLDEGAGEMDAKAFQQRMEELAAEIRFSVSRDQFYGSIRLLKDRQQESLELLRLSLNAPRFDDDAVERVRAQVLSGLRRETTNPNNISSKVWWRTAFPHHPYGRPSGGTLESLPLIQTEDIRDYVKRNFARDNLKIAVVGDIDAATLGQALDKVFGALPAKAQLQRVEPATISAVGRRIVVDLDVPQAVMIYGGTGLLRKDPDFMAAYIVNHILGGGSFSSRLYNEVREKRGLAYGVYSSLAPMEFTGLFQGSTQTRADGAKEALEVIEAEVRKMGAEGPTAEELAKAKSYLKGSYALGFDTSAKIASQLLYLQIEDLGIDYISKRDAMIDAVTLADTKRVAKRLAEGGLFVTVVGKPKGLTSKEPGG
ncbi:MAG: pitrilysin family protein [Pseudomonadota bacterium]